MRSEFHFEAFKFLLIESRFLAVELTGANAPPCCVSMASDALNKTIFDWRLFYGSSLAKAAVSALDSTFVKASDTDPLRPRIGNRYRYGNSEYEVTSVIDNRILLHSTDSPRRDAAKHLDVTLYNSMSIEQHAKVERFFREYNRYIIHMTDDRNIAKENTMKLAALRKQFEEWLKIFQQGPNARVLDNRRSGQKPLQKSYFSGGHKHMRKHK